MATLSHIDWSKPLTIDPMQRDLDAPIMRGVSGVETLTLEHEDVARFLDWASSSSWCHWFESDLQGLAERNGHALLTTCIPLVIFRYEFCSGGRLMQDAGTRVLMERLIAATREWRAVGVDTVAVSGFHLS